MLTVHSHTEQFLNGLADALRSLQSATVGFVKIIVTFSSVEALPTHLLVLNHKVTVNVFIRYHCSHLIELLKNAAKYQIMVCLVKSTLLSSLVCQLCDGRYTDRV